MFRKFLGMVMLTAWLAGCAASSTTPLVNRGNEATQPQAAGAAGEPQVSIGSLSPVGNTVPAQSAGDQVSAPSGASGAEALPGSASPAAPAGPASPAASVDSAQPAPQAAAPAEPVSLNPLTGLAVADPATLALSPALVSITNFPVSARPQAGLSFSPFVFEMYVGEGMTRFLALFYGDFPVKSDTPAQGGDQAMALSDDRIGPVRSGRLPYESLRQLYNGFLIMASASPNVKASLGQFTNVFGNDQSDINSALIPATRLKEIAEKNPRRLDQEALNVFSFDPAAPQGGKPGQSLWLPYSYLNQIFWRYDAASGSYHRFQDNADGQTFKQATDRLNGDPLTYENVVVLFANHHAQRETLIDIDFMYVKRMPALLFRDGQMYEIYWTTANGEYEKRTGQVRPLRFVDAKGNPFPLKPGQTWVEIVQAYAPYNETVASENYAALKNGRTPGSGHWAVHFYAPKSED
jgi:hypothetical protein